MTEAEWQASTYPSAMLDRMRHEASDRKLRLFTCACCRCVWDEIPSNTYQAAVESAELYADAQLDLKTLRAVKKAAYQLLDKEYGEWFGRRGKAFAAWSTCRPSTPAAAIETVAMLGRTPDPSSESTLGPAFAALLRDIFGNPFRPVAFDPR